MRQNVKLGTTKSGKPGLFTGNYQAMPLTQEEYDDLCFRMTPEDAAKYVKQRWDFELVLTR